ncbi:sensor histidine kinase [Cohnella hongkongensis]|uniref:histidine kinase n=1 Tax=Cohnella hongkongensis TaxID=178337 RepID=A0ABV9F6S9_9BACL
MIFPGLLRQTSIKYKLIAIFIFFVLIPFLLLSLVYVYYAQTILKEKIVVTHTEITKQIGQNLNVVFKDMVTTSHVVLANNDMGEVLSKNIYDDPVNIFGNIKMLNNLFTEIMYSVLNYPNSFVAIKDSYGNLHMSQNVPLGAIKDKIAGFIDRHASWPEGANTKWLSVEGLNSSNQNPYGIGLLMMLPYESIGHSKGTMLISVNEMNLYRILQSAKIDPAITIRIVNEQGSIVTSTDRAEIGLPYPDAASLQSVEAGSASSEYSRAHRAFVNAYSLSNGWRLVQTIPREVIYRDIERSRTLFISITGGFLALFAALSALLVGRITKPIIQLTEAMKEVQGGNLSVSVKISGRDEVGQLSKVFNTMVLRMNELIRRINEEERDKREAELKMLRSQIKPHFLFNTLNSIRWVADINKAKPVSDLIVSLATLLKSGILGNKEFVPLAEEIDNLRHYCNIQAIRYGGLFEVEYRVSEEAAMCPVINLILQPIIENSLIHGFNGLNRRGRIDVEAWTEDGALKIRIVDNGQGMTPEQLASIFTPKAEEQATKMRGIGLPNVRERLRLHYGGGFRLTIDSAPGQGTEVALDLPSRSQQGGADDD